MFAQEEARLRERMTHPLANALEVAFGCQHRKCSRVFTVQDHRYKVCCDCGATFVAESCSTDSVVLETYGISFFHVVGLAQPRQFLFSTACAADNSQEDFF